MRARAENIGAQLEVRTAPGRGTGDLSPGSRSFNRLVRGIVCETPQSLEQVNKNRAWEA